MPTIPEWIPPLPTADDLNEQNEISKTNANVIAEGEVLPIILGRSQVGGKIFAIDYDTGTSTWTVGVAWCIGEVNSVAQVWMNGAAPLGGVTQNDYTGTTGQTADGLLSGAISGYTDTLVITRPGGNIGVCYSAFQYTDSDYSSIPQFVAEIEGLKVNAGVYSDNPTRGISYLIESDILGVSGTIDTTSRNSVASDNDEIVTGSSPQEKRRIIGLTIDKPLPFGQWLKILAGYASCWINKEGNTYYFVSDRPKSQDATLTSADWHDKSFSINIADKDRLPTVVEVVYTDTTENIWRDKIAKDQDSGVPGGSTPRRVSRVKLPGITRYSQAKREAIERRRKLEAAATTISFTGFENQMVRQLGDVIDISRGTHFANQDFRIVAPPQKRLGRGVEIRASKYDASVYSNDQSANPSFGENSGFLGGGVTAGGVTTYRQASAPSSANEGDLWFDTDDNDRLYRYEGSPLAWVDVLASGATTYRQATAPSSPREGDLWFDTDDGNKIYRYEGSPLAWVDIQDDGITQIFYQSTAPVGGVVGDYWQDSDDFKWYRHSGGSPTWVFVTDPDIQLSLNNAATAQATADGKVTTFRQASPPTAEGEGDLWYDTDDGNKVYRWSGSPLSWVDVRDTGIAQALNDASNAQATADGKIVSYWQDSAPNPSPQPGEGDIWVDTNDGNRLYRWSSGSPFGWVDIQDDSITAAQADATQAIADASTAQATADGKVTTYISAAAPTPSPDTRAIGDLWLDTDNNIVYRWSGSNWNTTFASYGATLGTNLYDLDAATLLAGIDLRNDLAVTNVLGGLNFNPSMQIQASRNGTRGPAGYGANVAGTYPEYVVTSPETRDVLRFTANNVLVMSAIPCNPGTTYEISAYIRMQTTVTNMDLRVEEYNGTLPQGKFFIGSATHADGGQARTSLQTLINDQSVGTSYELIISDYTPTDTSVNWFSPSLYANGTGNDFYVDWWVVRDKSTLGSTAGTDLFDADGNVISDNVITNYNDADALKFNAAFTNWTSNTPDGWVRVGNVTRNTTSTFILTGYSSVLINSTAVADQYIEREPVATSPTVDMEFSGGSIMIGSVDVYLAAGGTSGAPGVAADLFTESVAQGGASNRYYRTVVPINTAASGRWQRLYFKVSAYGGTSAAVGSPTQGATFVSMRIKIGNFAASSTGRGAMSRGNRVIYADNVRFAILDPDMENEQQIWSDITGTGLPQNYAGTNEPDLGGLIYNSTFRVQNVERNRPAGWFLASTTNESNIGYRNNGLNDTLQLTGTGGDTTTAAHSTAVQVNPNQIYQLRVRLRGSVASTDGLYIRMAEYDGNWVQQRLYVARDTTIPTWDNDFDIQATRMRTDLGVENVAISSSYGDYNISYQPTSTAKFASVLIMNYNANTATDLYIGSVTMDPAPGALAPLDEADTGDIANNAVSRIAVGTDASSSINSTSYLDVVNVSIDVGTDISNASVLLLYTGDVQLTGTSSDDAYNVTLRALDNGNVSRGTQGILVQCRHDPETQMDATVGKSYYYATDQTINTTSATDLNNWTALTGIDTHSDAPNITLVSSTEFELDDGGVYLINATLSVEKNEGGSAGFGVLRMQDRTSGGSYVTSPGTSCKWQLVESGVNVTGDTVHISAVLNTAANHRFKFQIINQQDTSNDPTIKANGCRVDITRIDGLHTTLNRVGYETVAAVFEITTGLVTGTNSFEIEGRVDSTSGLSSANINDNRLIAFVRKK